MKASKNRCISPSKFGKTNNLKMLPLMKIFCVVVLLRTCAAGPGSHQPDTNSTASAAILVTVRAETLAIQKDYVHPLQPIYIWSPLCAGVLSFLVLCKTGQCYTALGNLNGGQRHMTTPNAGRGAGAGVFGVTGRSLVMITQQGERARQCRAGIPRAGITSQIKHDVQIYKAGGGSVCQMC
jgi:hypothetical protein